MSMRGPYAYFFSKVYAYVSAPWLKLTFAADIVFLKVCIIVQTEKTELEGACRAKDELLAVREAENEQIPLLRKELEELQVRKRMLL